MDTNTQKLEEIEYLEEKVAPEVERLESYVNQFDIEAGWFWQRYSIAKRVLIKLRQQKEKIQEKLKVEDK